MQSVCVCPREPDNHFCLIRPNMAPPGYGIREPVGRQAQPHRGPSTGQRVRIMPPIDSLTTAPKRRQIELNQKQNTSSCILLPVAFFFVFSAFPSARFCCRSSRDQISLPFPFWSLRICVHKTAETGNEKSELEEEKEKIHQILTEQRNVIVHNVVAGNAGALLPIVTFFSASVLIIHGMAHNPFSKHLLHLQSYQSTS